MLQVKRFRLKIEEFEKKAPHINGLVANTAFIAKLKKLKIKFLILVD